MSLCIKQNDAVLRYRTWDLIRSLCRNNGDPWLVLGAFNAVLHHHEKRVGRPRPKRQIASFRDVVGECGLRDLGFKGYPFTWCNRREGAQCISERLDRCLANTSWWHMFPNAIVTHGLVAYLDHVPLWVDMEGVVASLKIRVLFKFEAMWVGEQSCVVIIKETWGRCASQISMSEVVDLIKNLWISDGLLE